MYNGKIHHTESIEEHFQFLLTLNLRMTHICGFGECLNDDVIDPLTWLKSKNPWKKSLLLFPILSSSEDRNSTSSFVLLVEAFCREENIVNFRVWKKNQRNQKVNIMDKNSKNDKIWKYTM